MKKSKIKLLIFDFDGTLSDTIWSIREGLNITLSKYGYPERSYDEVRLAIGNGARNLVLRSLPKEALTDNNLLDDICAEFGRQYDECFIHCDGMYDGMLEALVYLRSKGYKLAVLSNKPDRYVKALVDLLAPELISMAMGQTELPLKPDPTVPRFIADSFGVDVSECAFIGDSDVDVMTAKNAGMVSVACSWGYREREKLLALSPDHLIDKPQMLEEIF